MHVLMSAQILFYRILKMVYKLVDSPVICKILQIDTILKSALNNTEVNPKPVPKLQQISVYCN